MAHTVATFSSAVINPRGNILSLTFTASDPGSTPSDDTIDSSKLTTLSFDKWSEDDATQGTGTKSGVRSVAIASWSQSGGTLTFEVQVEMLDSSFFAIGGDGTITAAENWCILEFSDGDTVGTPAMSSQALSFTNVGTVALGGGLLVHYSSAAHQAAGGSAGSMGGVNWNDLSGNARHLTGSAAPKDPFFVAAAENAPARMVFNTATTTEAGDPDDSDLDDRFSVSPGFNHGTVWVVGATFRLKDLTDQNVCGRDAVAPNRGWALRLQGGQFTYLSSPDGTAEEVAQFGVPNGTIQANVDYLVVVWRSAASVRAFVNGIEAQVTSNITNAAGIGGAAFFVGAKSSGTADMPPLRIFELTVHNAALTDARIALLIYQLARRALIDLAPASFGASQPMMIDRRPILMETVYTGNYFAHGPYGLQNGWRDTGQGAAALLAHLQGKLEHAMSVGADVGYDAWDLGINRIGGKIRGDVVSPRMLDNLTADQKTALQQFIEQNGFNQAGKRRLWLYTGGWLPLTNDGTLVTSAGSQMNNQFVPPITPAYYKANILDAWTSAIGIYCNHFIMDSAVKQKGKWVELVHDSGVRAAYELIGESIPTDENYQLNAAWFSMAGAPQAPWWNGGSKSSGYNQAWAVSESLTKIYFGIDDNDLLDLGNTSSTPDGEDNLTKTEIRQWIEKGGIPVGWHVNRHHDVLEAWAESNPAGLMTASPAAISPAMLAMNPIARFWLQLFGFGQ